MTKKNGQVLTLILAGGKGERLYPLTKNRTKPAVPFGGNYRIIDFPLSNCLHSGTTRIFVLVQYLSATLIQHLWRAWQVFSSPESGLLEIVPPQQKLADLWYRGTADAVFHNLNILQEHRPSQVMILSGDHIYRMDYNSFLDVHRESGAQVTVGGIKVPLEEGYRFGCLQTDKYGRIIQFEEKPENPSPLPNDPCNCLASMGIYIFETEHLVKMLALDARNPNSAHDFGRDILPVLVADGVHVQSYDYSSYEPNPYWRDIGTIDAYYQSSMDLLTDPPAFDLWGPDWPIRSAPTTAAPALVGPDALCKSSILAPGTHLNGCKISRSILGPGVKVDTEAAVEGSILLGNVKVGSNCRIRNCIVDAGIEIPDRTTIGLDTEKDQRLFSISPSGLTLVPAGLPIEEGYRHQEGH